MPPSSVRGWLGSFRFGLVLLAAACSPLETDSHAWSVRDSAGVVIAENRGRGPTTAALIDSLERTLDLGELVHTRAILPVAGSALLLAGGTESPLVEVAWETDAIRSLGRSGPGPGEYGGVQALCRCAGDTVVVQSFPARLSWLDPGGRFVRMLERPLFRYSTIAAAADCAAVATVVPDRPVISGRKVERTLRISWYLAGADSTVGVASIAGPDASIVELRGRSLPVPVPYGNVPSVVGHGDLIYVGPNDRPEVRVYDRHQGLVRIIRWEAVPDPVSAADRASYDDILLRLESLFGKEEVADFPPSSAFDLPSVKPLYSRIVVAEDGHLWVRRYPRIWERFEQLYRSEFNDDDQEWWVFDPDGKLLGLFAVPGGLHLHAIGRGRAFGVRRDSLDVESVVIAPLTPVLAPGGGGVR